jgi:hypothetical protein
MKRAGSTVAYVNEDPDLLTEEILPSLWQEYLEGLGCPEPEIWPCWRAFKDRTAYPFQKLRWHRWCDAWMRNKRR